MTPTAVTPIRSLRDYIATYKSMAPLPKTHHELYRGQGDNWPLLPSLFRRPNTVGLVRKTERAILQRFIEMIPARAPSRPTNDWDWLSFGQHFQLPTRLLDWSKDPLVALFFAVEKNPTAPIVYVYCAQKDQIVKRLDKADSPFQITVTRIMKPSPHSIRATLQGAWHTVHRIHRQKGREVFIPLTDMAFHDGRTNIIRIDPAFVAKIRGELARLGGITHATVYGEFESLCTAIRHEFGMK